MYLHPQAGEKEKSEEGGGGGGRAPFSRWLEHRSSSSFQQDRRGEKIFGVQNADGSLRSSFKVELKEGRKAVELEK